MTFVFPNLVVGSDLYEAGPTNPFDELQRVVQLNSADFEVHIAAVLVNGLASLPQENRFHFLGSMGKLVPVGSVPGEDGFHSVQCHQRTGSGPEYSRNLPAVPGCPGAIYSKATGTKPMGTAVPGPSVLALYTLRLCGFVPPC